MIFHCSKCGKEVEIDDNYCRFCGEKQNVEAHMWESKKEYYREWDKIIKKYEMGLSEMLRENNVKMGSFYPYDDTNIVNPYAIYLNQFVKRSVFVKHMLSK